MISKLKNKESALVILKIIKQSDNIGICHTKRSIINVICAIGCGTLCLRSFVPTIELLSLSFNLDCFAIETGIAEPTPAGTTETDNNHQHKSDNFSYCDM